MLLTDGFPFLSTFMGKADYESCLATSRLPDGRLFPLPITLPVEGPQDIGATLTLAHPRGDVLATITVQETYRIDPRSEAEALVGSCDETHPYVKEILAGPLHRASGRLELIRRPYHADFADLRMTATQVRARLAEMGRSSVVAFQTRNPLHRSHEEMIKRAAAEHEATILLHPVVGLTRPGDIDHFTRVRTYRALVAKHFAPGTVLLALLPLAMRMAGPREALLHALIRKHFGASHFIVGRDHAGPGLDSKGRPFFEAYEAQDLVMAHASEIGLTVVPFREMVYVPDEDRFEEESKVSPRTKTLSISGTQVRECLSKGESLPDWFTRPETAAILQQAYRPRREQGFCVWLTGLSGAGKSTIAEELRARLMEEGRTVTFLDGDEVRQTLSRGLGFSREDRDANVLRIGYVASEVVRHGGIAICAVISPFRDARNRCRSMMGEGFIEVFVDAPLALCETRDPKGLYAKSRAGLLKGLTGVDDPYEAPTAPEVHLADPIPSARTNADQILAELRRRGFAVDGETRTGQSG